MKKFAIYIAVILLILCIAGFLYWRIFLYIPEREIYLTRGGLHGIRYLVRYFPFTRENALKQWEEKIFKGRVVYTIEENQPRDAYVKAQSSNAASALYYKINIDLNRDPVISWKWRVREFPKKALPEKISLKKEEDFAARVYVIFPASFFTNSKVIEYIWAENLPVDTFDSSAYSKNIKLLVLRSGNYSEEWVYEQRDIRADYVSLFGEEPRLDVGAIAFMTDADSTKTTASSLYDEIKIGYKGGKK